MYQDDVLLEILREAKVSNEAGERIIDFTTRGRDSRDFFSLSRDKLYRMLTAAYEAGILQGANDAPRQD